MSDHLRSPALPAHAPDQSPVLRGMRIGQHALFVLLMLIGAVRGVGESAHPVPLALGAVLLTCWYAAGARLARTGHGRRTARLTTTARWWLAVLIVGWLALVAVSVEFSWVAFALFFLCMHLLPIRSGAVVVVLLTGAVVTAQLGQAPGSPAPKVLGPCLGALVAVGMALAYRRLVAESEQRRRLVEELIGAQDDLVATHDELARTQREAGALAERTRLARDIHDTLAQGFSSIVLLARDGQACADPGTRQVLRQIEGTAVDNLDEARRVVHALAPAALEDAPLPGAIGRLLDRLGEQTGIRVQLGVDGDPQPLATAQEVALLRVAQSALANVRLHSAATRVGVTVTYLPEETRLDVVDDGRGFDPDRLEAAPLGDTGFGLRAMRARLAELGGTLLVESAPGEGTAVAATIPVPVPHQASPGVGAADVPLVPAPVVPSVLAQVPTPGVLPVSTPERQREGLGG